MKKDYRYLTEFEMISAPRWATHYQIFNGAIIWESKEFYQRTDSFCGKVKQASKLTKCRKITDTDSEVMSIDNCIAYLFKNGVDIDYSNFIRIKKLYTELSKSNQLQTPESYNLNP